MANQSSKAKTKRLPKGQRTHTRRLKQIASKDAGITNPQSRPVRSVRVHKKPAQS